MKNNFNLDASNKQDNHHMLSVNQCLDNECVDIANGLDSNQANIRLTKHGLNLLPTKKPTPLFFRFLAQFSDAMIMVLVAAAFVSAAIAIFNKEPTELIDSGVILIIILINAIIGLVQQDKANHAMQALKDLSRPYAKVRRDGEIKKISAEQLTCGDIVILEAGDSVPADLRLISAINLKIQEATLTGESLPSEKHTAKCQDINTPLGDRKNMAYSSSTVVYGRGEGVVIAIGSNTQVGKIATMLATNKKDDTPLQKQLAKTAQIISIGILIIAFVIFIMSIFNGNSAIDSFLTSIAIAVAAIPEGLPAVITIVLAIGVRVMSAKKAIIRNIPAVEVLGSTQVICSDKTGTLTQNKMTVTNCYTLSSNNGYNANLSLATSTQKTLALGLALCNDTMISKDGNLIGDPTETALTDYAIKHKLEFVNLKRIGELPFDSNRKLMTTTNSDGHIKTSFIKGATDILISKCTHIALDTTTTNTTTTSNTTDTINIVGNNALTITPITQSHINKVLSMCDSYASSGLRVLALALDHTASNKEENLTFIGLVAMLDPPREGVADAIKECRNASIKTVMITGDHMTTATAIATSIGIQGKAIDGATLDNIDDTTLKNTLTDYGVFARVSPANKVRIVKTYKDLNTVVAMTGDGVNDAPALHAADIGVGMGITGTDVAKGASDMILADDNFATIVAAVKEGRRVYHNIKKSIKFLLSANIAEVLGLFIITVFFKLSFLTPIMILWVNLVTDSLPGLALGLEKAEPDIMNIPPIKQSNLLKGKYGLQIIIQGLMQTILVLTVYLIGYFALPPQSGFSQLSQAATMAFVTLCMIQLFHAYNCRSNKSLLSHNPLSNKILNLSFIICSVLAISILYISPIASIFQLIPLSIHTMTISMIAAFLIIPLVELHKLTIRNL